MNLVRHVPDPATLIFKLNAIPVTILNRECEDVQKGLRYMREKKKTGKQRRGFVLPVLAELPPCYSKSSNVLAKG